MANQTMVKFGYPESAIAETDHWAVLLRPKQVTAGCLVLACKEDGTSLGEISPEAAGELPSVAAKLEAATKEAYGPDKFNYLALMMVDPHVHFHVIPRYSRPVNVGGTQVPDTGWPKHPDMGSVASLTDEQMQNMLDTLKEKWPE